MKEALSKVSIYNNIIARFVDEINSKYGMTLTFTTLEPCEVGHWAKTFQMDSGNSKAPKSPRPWQAHKEPCRYHTTMLTNTNRVATATSITTTAYTHRSTPYAMQVQVQQKEIIRLTDMVAQ